MKGEFSRPETTTDEQLSETLFGRQQDLNTVLKMLRSPDCRLLTLTGLGGIGKTCLAQLAAKQAQFDFDNQVYWVSLQPITAPQYFVPAVMEQLGLRSRSGDDPSAQLLRFLQQRHLLLVLDNFEHVLEASEFVADILKYTTQVKFLVTSREVLNLRQEWVWPVRGIAYPGQEQVPEAQDYAAIRLFDACARRVDPNFALQQELSSVAQICALVEGSPLAIELASGWLKALTCRDILDELHRDIDILSTRMRDVPERHRSIRAVFDRSWHLLTPDEQQVLARLSVFRGSFTREAASAVAEASINRLTPLIDKSMLYHRRDGRYQFHELFRQYAYERLHNDGEAAAQTGTALTAYYRNFLASRFEDVWGARQREAIREVADELHNIRSLSEQLTVTADAATSRRAIHMVSEVYQFLGHYQEAANLMQQVITQLENEELDWINEEYLHLLAEMLNNLGWLCIRLGEFESAAQVIERAEAIYDTHQIRPAAGFATDPRLSLAELKGIQGDHAGAQTLSEAAYRDAITKGDLLNGSLALYLQTNVALENADYARAQSHIEDAIFLTRKAGNLWFLAYCLNQQGHVHRELGEYASAQQRYEESYRIREKFDDPEGQGVALNHLGTLALLQDRYEQAVELFQTSLPIYQHIEDRGGLFTAHEGLGLAYCALSQFHASRDHLLQALRVISEVDVASWWLSLCEAAGEFFTVTGTVERGIALIRLAQQHPESKAATRTRAERWLQRTKGNTGLNTDKFELNAVKRWLEPELSAQPLQDDGSMPVQSGLVEPLTERELEILRLIADGMTNQEIADHLVLVVGTVKSHNYNIFSKLGVRNRSQAVKYARELNLL